VKSRSALMPSTTSQKFAVYWSNSAASLGFSIVEHSPQILILELFYERLVSGAKAPGGPVRATGRLSSPRTIFSQGEKGTVCTTRTSASPASRHPQSRAIPAHLR